MRRFAFFAMAAALVDVGLGTGLERLYRRTRMGNAGGLTNYQIGKPAEILILGSSRVSEQLDPEVIHHAFSLETFNAGIVGHDFLYSMMLFDLWKGAHGPPSAVILNVDPVSLVRDEDELQKASLFLPYSVESAVVRAVLNTRGPFERLKRISHLYRTNGKLFSTLKGQFVHSDPAFDGFEPLEGALDPKTVRLPTVENQMLAAGKPFWTFKLDLFRDFLRYCSLNEVRVVLVHSPRFREDRRAHELWVSRVKQLLTAYPEIQFLDVSESSHPQEFANRPDLFHDDYHLNAQGAAVYSHVIAVELGKLWGRLPMALGSRDRRGGGTGDLAKPQADAIPESVNTTPNAAVLSATAAVGAADRADAEPGAQ